ncbi:MAG: hypothetical protein V4622_04745 [Bacteroidota bacterium]
MFLKYPNVTLTIIEAKNSKAFRTSAILALLGIVILILSITLFKVGTIRTSGVVISVICMASPFALRFFIDEYRKIGILRLEKNGIIAKYDNKESISFTKDLIENLSVEIEDFEGETKITDLISRSKAMDVRTGEGNKVSWTYNNENYTIQFKLENEVQKVKTIYFVKYLTS